MLLDVVVDELDRRCVPFALIGAAALAVHGISRSTLDIDLLVTDRRVLDATFWAALAADIERDSRPGDATDPLAGVVRFRAFEERDVDIVVGRGGWNVDVVTHAENARHHGRDLPTARMEDLILLKLYAGGSQDRWDIEQLLATSDKAAVIGAVERSLDRLPPDAQRLWRVLRSE
jgi:predicted nucleotidyltransferase